MKKLILSGIISLVTLVSIGQTNTKLGTTTNKVEIKNKLLIDGSTTLNGQAQSKVLSTDISGNVILVSVAGGGSRPAATTSSLGEIIVSTDGSLHIDVDGTLHAIGFIGGTSAKYWRGDNTWQNLVMAAISDFPNPSGHTGQYLQYNGSAFVWSSPTGGTGLVDGYTSLSDGTNTAVSSGATPIRFRSADNKLSVLVGNNDPTFGDNVLLTVNQANLILGESQITNLTTDLSGKEPSLPGSGTTFKYLRGDKTWQTLNTSIVPESGNLYYLDSRVEAYAVNVYSKLNHTHLLGALSNVLIDGATNGQVLKFNGSNWIPFTLPSGIAPTLVASGDVSGSNTLPNVVLTIANSAVTNAKLANMANATIKGRITSGAGAPEDIDMSTLKGSTMLDLANIPIQNLQIAVNSAQATTNGNKLDKNNSAPTGIFDGSGTTQFKLPRNTDAVLNRDTASLFTFGGGTGITNDTLWVSTSSVYGSLYLDGSDSVVVTKIIVVMQGSSPSLTVDIKFGTTLNSGGTSLVSGGILSTSITTGTTVTSITNPKIPPGNHIWATSPTAPPGQKPTGLYITVIGYKIRK